MSGLVNVREVSHRGFRIFGRAESCHGGSIRVQESSGAFCGARVWLFHDGATCTEHLGEHHKPTPLLDVPNAKSMIAALQAFVDEAEANKLTEPAEAPKEAT